MPTKPTIANCTFAFECPRQWEMLATTQDRKVRNCHHCNRDVHLVETGAEWNERLAQGACVAVRASEIIRMGEAQGRYDPDAGLR